MKKLFFFLFYRLPHAAKTILNPKDPQARFPLSHG